jgi:hypothetical protein
MGLAAEKTKAGRLGEMRKNGEKLIRRLLVEAELSEREGKEGGEASNVWGLETVDCVEWEGRKGRREVTEGVFGGVVVVVEAIVGDLEVEVLKVKVVGKVDREVRVERERKRAKGGTSGSDEGVDHLRRVHDVVKPGCGDVKGGEGEVAEVEEGIVEVASSDTVFRVFFADDESVDEGAGVGEKWRWEGLEKREIECRWWTAFFCIRPFVQVTEVGGRRLLPVEGRDCNTLDIVADVHDSANEVMDGAFDAWAGHTLVGGVAVDLIDGIVKIEVIEGHLLDQCPQAPVAP